jgi:hypothetical protein
MCVFGAGRFRFTAGSCVRLRGTSSVGKETPMQHAPPSLERGNPPELPEYPTEEEREARARWEIEHVKWRTPHCRPSGYHEAFNSDLNEISRIVWITELSHARVRQMRDEFLDGRDVLKREQESAERTGSRRGSASR